MTDSCCFCYASWEQNPSLISCFAFTSCYEGKLHLNPYNPQLHHALIPKQKCNLLLQTNNKIILSLYLLIIKNQMKYFCRDAIFQNVKLQLNPWGQSSKCPSGPVALTGWQSSQGKALSLLCSSVLSWTTAAGHYHGWCDGLWSAPEVTCLYTASTLLHNSGLLSKQSAGACQKLRKQ